MTCSSCGLVANAVPAGTFAAASRSGSPVQERGRYSSRSISARPSGPARLGHADPAITLRVYAHVIRSAEAAAADIFAEAVKAAC